MQAHEAPLLVALRLFALAAAQPAHALPLVHVESFEALPGSTYTLTNAFDDGAFDYFNRYAVPDNSNGARNNYQLGWDGNFGIHAQDIGGGGSSTGSIGIAGVDIAGRSQFQVVISLGALNSEPNFFNFEASDGDGIKIFARIDGGADVLIGQFSPPPSGAGDLYRDDDFDAVGTGAQLTQALTDFAFLIAGVGATLDLRVELTLTGDFESLSLDHLRVFGVPEPTTLALIALAMLAIVFRHRGARGRGFMTRRGRRARGMRRH